MTPQQDYDNATAARIAASRARQAAWDALPAEPTEAEEAAFELIFPGLVAAVKDAESAQAAAAESLRLAKMTPELAAAAEEQRLASAAQLAAIERLAAKDKQPAFRAHCICGGYHGVSADRKSCDDCR